MNATRTIPLTQGFAALVDADDYDELISLGSWCIIRPFPTSKNIYAGRFMRRDDGTKALIRMHSHLTGWKMVDHINGDGLDNRRENLRPTDHRRNGLTARLSSRNKSGFKGVHSASNGKWRAAISGRSLGHFDTPEEAAEAYRRAAVEMFGNDDVLTSNRVDEIKPSAVPATPLFHYHG